MVMEIASEVGVNENTLLADEIVLLSKKLEDVKSALTMLNEVSTKDCKREVFIAELNQTENYISSVKEVGCLPLLEYMYKFDSDKFDTFL